MNIFKKIIKHILNKKTISSKKAWLSPNGYLEGNVSIGQNTYINSGYRIVAGNKSTVTIGKFCAIGRNFSAASRTHNQLRPTADEEHPNHLTLENSIEIGDYIWIGDNVFIKDGVKIKDYSIIGANSVVVHDVEKFEVVGGNPAKHIKINTSHYKYKSNIENK